MRKIILIFIIFFAGSAVMTYSDLYAQSCCGRVALPTGGLEQRPLLKNQFEFRFSYENSQLGKILLEGESFDDPLSRNNRTNIVSITASYGISERLSGVIVLPFKWTRLSLLNDRVIRKTSGIGDMAILAKYRLLAPISPKEPELAVGVGLKAPTGGYDEADFFGVMSASQQVGSGAYDFIGSAYYSQLVSDFNLFSSALFRYPTKNNRGYQFGEELEIRSSVVYIGLGEYIAPIIGVHGRLTARANYDGSNLDSYGGGAYRDSGGEWIYINPGIEFKPINNCGVHFEVSVPVYNRVNGIQISETVTWRLATSFSN